MPSYRQLKLWNSLRLSNKRLMDEVGELEKRLQKPIDKVAMPRMWYLVKVVHSRISDEHVRHPLALALTENDGGTHADTYGKE